MWIFLISCPAVAVVAVLYFGWRLMLRRIDTKIHANCGGEQGKQRGTVKTMQYLLDLFYSFLGSCVLASILGFVGALNWQQGVVWGALVWLGLWLPTCRFRHAVGRTTRRYVALEIFGQLLVYIISSVLFSIWY